jgi:hypothetical protein
LIREVRLRTEPPIAIDGIELVGLPLDAAVATAVFTASAAPTDATIDLLGTALTPAPSSSTTNPQPDGSVVVTCDGNALCAGIEFSVARGTNAAVGTVRVFAEVRGGAETCSGAGPSYLELKLTEQAAVLP